MASSYKATQKGKSTSLSPVQIAVGQGSSTKLHMSAVEVIELIMDHEQSASHSNFHCLPIRFARPYSLARFLDLLEDGGIAKRGFGHDFSGLSIEGHVKGFNAVQLLQDALDSTRAAATAHSDVEFVIVLVSGRHCDRLRGVVGKKVGKDDYCVWWISGCECNFRFGDFNRRSKSCQSLSTVCECDDCRRSFQGCFGIACCAPSGMTRLLVLCC